MPRKGKSGHLPKGDTFADLMRKWGTGEKKTRQLLQHGIAAGHYEVLVTQRPDVTGVMNRCVLYRTLPTHSDRASHGTPPE